MAFLDNKIKRSCCTINSILLDQNCSGRLLMMTCFSRLWRPLYAESSGGPEVILYLSVSVSSTTSSFPCHPTSFNFPPLSFVTKSLSLRVTAAILKGIPHLKGALGGLSVLFNLSLIQRRDGIHVQVRAVPCLIRRKIITSLQRLCAGLLPSVSLG